MRQERGELEALVTELLEKNNVNPQLVRADSVRIEFKEAFGAVLVAELFIPVDFGER